MTRERCRLWWGYVFLALALPLGARAAAVPRGNEFQVNAYTSADQGYASVSAAANGDFVVAWQSRLDGFLDIFARRFTSAGIALAGEFQVNTYTSSYQAFPSVAAEADGDFVVVWESPQDGSDFGIFGRRFSSAGVPLAGEFQINTYTPDDQSLPKVAADADGDFVVTWEVYEDTFFKNVFAQRFSSTGAPLASEFQVNTFTALSQRSPKVAAGASGDFVVAWENDFQDGSSTGIFARRFASDGTPTASEFQVNTYTSGIQRCASVSVNASDDFVIAWHSDEQDGSSYGVFARLFSSSGAPQASELQVNSHTSSSQRNPSVTTVAGGDFVVAWSNYQDDLSVDIFAQRLASDGTRVATELQVNTYTSHNQTVASVAALGADGFVVTWESYGQDGSDQGVFAQRFAETAILDIDADGSTQALTDGLLVLRRFFGFTGTTLTSGATAGGCTRCDAASIVPYFTELGLTLDIDGDSATEALTDGLLVLRFLFGFGGTTLTTGAVDADCTRCDAAVIVPYLQGLL
jgi:hypothetical protein